MPLPYNAERVELRLRIFNYYKQGKSAADTTEQICKDYGKNVVSLGICKMWFTKFMSGKYNFKSNHATRSELKALLKENRHRTQQQFAQLLGVHHSTVWFHLKAIRGNRQKVSQVIKIKSQLEALVTKNPWQPEWQLAVKLRSTQQTVRRHLKAIKKYRKRRKHGSTIRKKLEALLKTKPHRTKKQLAEQLGVSYSTVWRHLKAINDYRKILIQINSTIRNQLKALLERNPCQTQRQLAERLGVTQTTVCYHLKAIRRRNRKRRIPQLLHLEDTWTAGRSKRTRAKHNINSIACFKQ